MSSTRAADHLVVLLHGLGRTRRSLARMDRALVHAGFSTMRIDYPSTRRPIERHAEAVAEQLSRAPVPAKLSFVTHSLGGLVLRQLCTYEAPWREAMARVVMLAPPNQGASLAATLDKGGLIRAILGPSFGQIASGRAETLPAPDVPFAIFAGNAPGVPGDGLLRIEETRLEGAAEHHVVPTIHTFIMNHPAVIAGTIAFLRGSPD